jgi:hypothetical protein
MAERQAQTGMVMESIPSAQMQWSVEYSLGPQDTFLTERVLFRNPGTSAYPWMSWSNAALPSAPDTEFLASAIRQGVKTFAGL